MPSFKYLTNPLVISDKFISSIITTKRNKTMTAPTYTNIRMTDKNSAPNSSHNTAEQKKEKTKYIADLTGLLLITTRIEEMIKKIQM